ncbi:MAG: hypothetical protein GYB20_20150 [Oceanospirillales bacterium]|nr:hypothetical protein [Oceanospirillales bacterium]
MTIRTLPEASARLEEAVKASSGDRHSAQDLYDCYEMVAIQILDSNFENFPEGELELYLRGYLAAIEYQFLTENIPY